MGKQYSASGTRSAGHAQIMVLSASALVACNAETRGAYVSQEYDVNEEWEEEEEEEDWELDAGFVDVNADDSIACSGRDEAVPKDSFDNVDSHWLDEVEAHWRDEAEAGDASARGNWLDQLGDDYVVADLEGTCDRLVQYLIGHPRGLVTKRRTAPGGKSSKRYFGDERSEDVMADKVVTGCWACGKLDHESNECPFKRCFVCSSQGHEQADCPSKKDWCSRCKSRGHQIKECPLTAYSSGIQDEETGTDIFFVRCIICREEGHSNCADVPGATPSSGFQSQLQVQTGRSCDSRDTNVAIGPSTDSNEDYEENRPVEPSGPPPSRLRLSPSPSGWGCQPSTWGLKPRATLQANRWVQSANMPLGQAFPWSSHNGRWANHPRQAEQHPWHHPAPQIEGQYLQRPWQQQSQQYGQWRTQWPQSRNFEGQPSSKRPRW